jgi:hypothetical protein
MIFKEINAMRSRVLYALLASLSACNPASQQQAKLIEILTVACIVDGIVVPVAQPIVAAQGSAGASVTSVDLLVHPAVVGPARHSRVRRSVPRPSQWSVRAPSRP